jgi:hypothetical protein
MYQYLKDPITKAWLHHIYNSAKIYQYGWLQVITGSVRSGKSMTACTLAELLAERPLDEYNFAFTPKEYLKSLDNLDYVGEPLVWSEMGTALSARKWYTLSNILVTECMQTMMIKKPIIFIDCPDLGFIDVQVRRLIYHFSEVRRWERHPPKLYIYRISVDRKTGEPFFPHPVLSIHGTRYKIKCLQIVYKPSEKVWEIYDKKQMEYKEKLRKQHLKTIEKAEAELVGKEMTIYDYINLIQKSPDDFKTAKGNWSVDLIRAKLNINATTAKQIWAFLTAKKPILN